MTTPNDMQAPTEIYVWIVPTKWGDGGSSFIRAWTDNPSRVQGLRDSIGLEPAVYRLVSRHDVQADERSKSAFDTLPDDYETGDY